MDAEAQPAPEPTKETTVDNSELIAAIEQLAADATDEHWQNFYRTLVKSRFLVVLGEAVDGITDGEVVRKPDMDGVGFSAVRDDLGKVTVPAFTDRAALKRWRPEGCPWMVLPAGILIPTIAHEGGAHLDINPAGPNSIRVSDREMESLLQGKFPPTPRTAEALLPVLLDPQATITAFELPAEAISVLRNAFMLRREVIDAYAFTLSQGGEQRQIVGLRFNDKPSRATMNAWVDTLNTILAEVMPAARSLDFIHVNDRDVLARVAQSVEAFFYRR